MFYCYCFKVQELLRNAESYQSEVQEVLKASDLPPSSKLKHLIDRSLEIDVETMELKSLKWVR